MQSNLVCLGDYHKIFSKVICLLAELLVKIRLYFLQTLEDVLLHLSQEDELTQQKNANNSKASYVNT